MISDQNLTHKEFYQRSEYAEFPQEHRSGGKGPVNLIRVEQEAHQFTDAAVSDYVLQLVLTADMDFRWDIEGKYWSAPQRVSAGTIILAPAHEQIAYCCGGNHNLMIVAFPERYLSDLLDEVGIPLSAFDALCGPMLKNSTLQKEMMALWNATKSDSPLAALDTEARTQTIVSRLLTMTKAQEQSDTTLLSDEEWQRLWDFVRDPELGVPTLKALARRFDRPQRALHNAIKRKTGRTFHQLVIEDRISRARDLLANSNNPIANIAYACGFSSQQHMTNSFSQKLGVSPGRYRREHRT